MKDKINRANSSPKINISNSTPKYNNSSMETIIENDKENSTASHNDNHHNYNKISPSHGSSPRSGMPYMVDTSLLNKLLPPIKDWTEFLGEGEYDHINFIKYIEHILKVYEAPDEAILTRLPRLFEGLALDWFINKQEAVGYQDWTTWKELIKAQFGTRMWEKKMRKAFENDFFDPIKKIHINGALLRKRGLIAFIKT